MTTADAPSIPLPREPVAAEQGGTERPMRETVDTMDLPALLRAHPTAANARMAADYIVKLEATIQSERTSASRQVREALERAAKLADKAARLYRISPQTDYAIGAGFISTSLARDIRKLASES